MHSGRRQCRWRRARAGEVAYAQSLPPTDLRAVVTLCPAEEPAPCTVTRQPNTAAGRDAGWAEWLAWHPQEAGYSVELDVWDWAPGEDFVAGMQSALKRADRLLAVCAEAYFSSPFGGAELRAAFAQQSAGRMVPVIVEPVALPPLYAPLIHPDPTGLDEAAAADRLRTRLAEGRPPAPVVPPR